MFKAIFGILQINKCNYVSVILNDNIYSHGLQTDIQNSLKQSNITLCFNINLVIDGDPPDVIEKKLGSLLDLYTEDEDVTIIYLGYSSDLIQIVNSLSNLLSKKYSYFNKVIIISSEAAINGIHSMNVSSKIKLFLIEFDKNSIVDYTDLLMYYTITFLNPLLENSSDPTAISDIHAKLPWLFEFIMINLGYTEAPIQMFQNSSYKSIPYFSLNNFNQMSLRLKTSQYFRFLFYSLNFLKTNLNEVLCVNCSEYLNDSSIQLLITKMRNSQINLANNIPYNLRNYMTMKDGSLNFNNNNSNIYNIFDYTIDRTVSILKSFNHITRTADVRIRVSLKIKFLYKSFVSV